MAATTNNNSRWPLALLAVLLIYALATGMLVLSLPVKDGGRDWFWYDSPQYVRTGLFFIRNDDQVVDRDLASATQEQLR